MLLEAPKHSWTKKSCFSASKTLPSPVPPVLSCKLSPGDLGGWILFQGKCGGGKEVPPQAHECEASQNCCAVFILCTGLLQGHRDSCATRVQGMNPCRAHSCSSCASTSGHRPRDREQCLDMDSPLHRLSSPWAATNPRRATGECPGSKGRVSEAAELFPFRFP